MSRQQRVSAIHYTIHNKKGINGIQWSSICFMYLLLMILRVEGSTFSFQIQIMRAESNFHTHMFVASKRDSHPKSFKIVRSNIVNKSSEMILTISDWKSMKKFENWTNSDFPDEWIMNEIVFLIGSAIRFHLLKVVVHQTDFHSNRFDGPMIAFAPLLTYPSSFCFTEFIQTDSLHSTGH